ncbi:conserved hypothetical protein [Salmonella enterica subsp. enterica serovar Paratyphi A]|nr:conserved hypothetical protein [Salmonella enterica subsp. enterica serovar Paratyphi A]
MAYDIFLKIDGIDGESMDDKHKNEIEVLGWRWNIHQESTMHAGSGLGSGKVSVTNLEFEHYIDRASPNLFKYCASGKHIPQAILVMRKAGGNPLEYLKYTFTDLIVAVVSPSGNREGEIASRERIELSFSRNPPCTPVAVSVPVRSPSLIFHLNITSIAPARTCSNTALPVSTFRRPFRLCVRLAAIRWSTSSTLSQI